MSEFDAPEIAPKDRDIAHVQPEIVNVVAPEEVEDVAVVSEPEPVAEENPALTPSAPKPAEKPLAPEKPRPTVSYNDPYSSDPVDFLCCRG